MTSFVILANGLLLKSFSLKKLLLKHLKKEYETIIEKMQLAAKEGSFTCSFKTISDGAIHQLKEVGFNVQVRNLYNRSTLGSTSTKYYEVLFAQ